MNEEYRIIIIKKAFVSSILSMLLGISIYILCRYNTVIAVSHLTNTLSIFEDIREVTTKYNYPNWFLYNLPDALWVYSYSVLVIAIWGYRKSIESKLWLSTIPILSIGFEIGQYFNIIRGTYDTNDIIYSVAAIIMGLYTIKIIKKREERKVQSND